MSSYRQILYHIVFRTKDSLQTLPHSSSKDLYRYIWGIVKNKNCILYQINGMEDHIHILSDLHPSISLSDYIKDIKVASSIWMKSSGKFPNFEGWSLGYCALTYSYKEKNIILNYIKNQQIHHKTTSYSDELKDLLLKSGVKYDERFLP